MTYEPLHHKYRPQTFAQLAGQDAIAQTLSNALTSEKIAPAYLFCGPRGTGKTSSARILAKSLNCMATDKPTPAPCGKCEACVSITNGSALDVIEIDAASNTGVDNIREIIERVQFAPVQFRYKVYVIDECLTGDSLINTNEGFMRLDNPKIQGKKVLSYDEKSKQWEYKKVIRWLDQGIKETLKIKTNHREIRCTGNHLIRTTDGWIKANELREGMKILSPVNVDAGVLSINTEQMVESDVLPEDTSLKIINTEQNQLVNGSRIFNNTPSPQWNTSLEVIEKISVIGKENVYDIEVEDNHNFVANGLLVHNCHMLSTAAFNALLKTLEEPPSRVIFVLATTDPQRVLPTIISRCQRFDYRRIPLDAMVKHLGYIATEESIDIDSGALSLVAQLSNGGMRDAESLLDQLSLLSGTITTQKVWDLVGSVSEQDLLELLSAIATDNPETVIVQCRKLLDRGREPLILLQNLANFYLSLLIAKTAPGRSDLVTVTEETWQKLCQTAHHWPMETILQGQKKLKDSELQIKNTTQPRLWLEITLLNLLPSANRVVATNAVINPTPTPIPSPPPVAQKTFTPPPKQEESPLAIPTTVNSQPSPPPEKETTTPPPAFNSLEELKEKVASTISAVMTKSFLVQQCHILDYQNTTITIGVITEFFLKLSKQHQPAMEKAFSQILGKSINLVFQVQEGKETTKKVFDNPPSSPIEEKPPYSPPPPVNSQPVEKKEEIITPSPQPLVADNEIKIAKTSSAQIKQVAETFAKNLNGEILDNIDSPPFIIPPPEIKVINRPELDIEDEDDLPF
ncbi:MAG: DNA polymerase III subunit gamma/tau [Cyanobacterium sp.]